MFSTKKVAFHKSSVGWKNPTQADAAAKPRPIKSSVSEGGTPPFVFFNASQGVLTSSHSWEPLV